MPWVMKHKTRARFWNGSELVERWGAKEFSNSEKEVTPLPPGLKWAPTRVRTGAPRNTKQERRSRKRHYAID